MDKTGFLTQKYWDNRYQDGQIGWDIGSISNPLKVYFDQLSDKSMNILIPGAGNAYEAEYLHNLGFKHVNLVDISPTVIQQFKTRVPNFPVENIKLQDFFEVKGTFDLQIEQTFFCALHPSLRFRYVKQTASLLKKGGYLVGLLFGVKFDKDTPPFGGDIEEYTELLEPYFDIEILEECYNSIKPRMGKELFIKLRKK